MWYISFRGESSRGVHNILVYHDNGRPHHHPALLPTGGVNPRLRELRGFAIIGNLLYVLNAYKRYSQILLYEKNKDETYAFQRVYASKDTVNSIVHPYDLTFDEEGNCYVSNQDTNVVTRLRGADTPHSIAPHLHQSYPSDTFLAGTFVPSAVGALPSTPHPPPPDVPAPHGLEVSFADDKRAKVASSVRGTLFQAGYLYVADEPGDTVKVYHGETGQLCGEIKGNNLSAPVHLLLNEATKVLYIGSTGNHSVVNCDLSHGAPSGVAAPTTFIDGHVRHVSDMAFDTDGYFYAAERKTNSIKRFQPDGKAMGEFITGLPDEPEFMLHIPAQFQN